MKQLYACPLLSPHQMLGSLAGRVDGCEWLEALHATAMLGRYNVPRLTGGPDLWDGSVLLKTLALAQLKSMQLDAAARALSPDERAEAWLDTSEAGARVRRALR